MFRVTYRTLIMTTKLKIAVGEGWGFLSVGRVQLEFNLGRAGGKNHQCLRRNLSRWRHLATISFLLLSVVLGSAREMCVFSIRQRWQILTLLQSEAEDGPVLIVCGLLILQLPDVT